ncbi:MAG TPA: hypothetical protein DCO77_14555 [Nitrospiraceae bacterium]|nr:hypothetical protein [Nitrospiraceae bacterium]
MLLRGKQMNNERIKFFSKGKNIFSHHGHARKERLYHLILKPGPKDFLCVFAASRETLFAFGLGATYFLIWAVSIFLLRVLCG